MRRGWTLALGGGAAAALSASAFVSHGARAGEWHGITIGKAPGGPVKRDPAGIPDDPHQFVSAASPGFPWQAATARLDRNGRVMAVTFTTDCCADWPMFDVPLSPEEEARVARLEAAVPDRFAEGRAPPPVQSD